MEPSSATFRFQSHSLSPIFSTEHPLIHVIPVSPKLSSNTTLTVATAKKKSNFEGVSEELKALASQNLDFASSRRLVRAAFTEVHQQLDHFLFKVTLIFLFIKLCILVSFAKLIFEITWLMFGRSYSKNLVTSKLKIFSFYLKQSYFKCVFGRALEKMILNEIDFEIIWFMFVFFFLLQI